MPRPEILYSQYFMGGRALPSTIDVSASEQDLVDSETRWWIAPGSANALVSGSHASPAAGGNRRFAGVYLRPPSKDPSKPRTNERPT